MNMVLERDIIAALPSLLQEVVGQSVTERSPLPELNSSGVDLVLVAGTYRFVVTATARV